MPTTIQQTITAYQFNELSDQAKDKVREWFIADGTDHIEYVLDDFKEQMLALDIHVEDIQYSVAYRQGDGASWTGSMKLSPFLERLKPDHPLFTRGVVLVELTRNGWVEEDVQVCRNGAWYNHSGTMALDGIGVSSFDESDKISHGIMQGASVSELFDVALGGSDSWDDVHEALLDEAKSHADKLYADLQKAYEWEISDEHIAECAEINEWLFDENGKMIN